MGKVGNPNSVQTPASFLPTLFFAILLFCPFLYLHQSSVPLPGSLPLYYHCLANTTFIFLKRKCYHHPIPFSINHSNWRR